MAVIDYAVTDPATGETVKTYDTISDEDLTAAIGRAAEAHRGWGRETSVEQRAKVIARVAELHEERKQKLGEIIVREMGKPIEQAVGEVEFAAAIYQYYADNAADLLEDEPIDLLEGEGSAFIRRTSVGLLLGIMPWNYPYYQVARFAGPNLVVGNTILLKHAPQCPESSAVMEQIFHEAGVPADAYININAAKRFIVLEDHYDQFVEKFTKALTGVEPGDPKSPDTTIGPLSSSGAADRLEQQVTEALDKGARLVAGGGREGNFFKSAVLTDITPDNPAYTEEFFGPGAQVYKVASEEEAVRLANDTPYGLGSYVFTTDHDPAPCVADKIEAGMVFVNAVGAEGVELPFGGVKNSGFGRELGRFGADEFVNKKLIRVGGCRFTVRSPRRGPG